MKALVTGGRSGIGAAIVAALGDADVTVLDLADGHDVGDPAAWRALDGAFDAAFLNAGVVTGEPDVAAMADEQYRRMVGVNLDGVVLGVRELAARLMPTAARSSPPPRSPASSARRSTPSTPRRSTRSSASCAASPRNCRREASGSTRSAPASPTRRSSSRSFAARCPRR